MRPATDPPTAPPTAAAPVSYTHLDVYKRQEYEQAVQTFEQKSEEYARKVEELNRKKEEGRIKTYVKVGQSEPELCYVEINLSLIHILYRRKPTTAF